MKIIRLIAFTLPFLFFTACGNEKKSSTDEAKVEKKLEDKKEDETPDPKQMVQDEIDHSWEPLESNAFHFTINFPAIEGYSVKEVISTEMHEVYGEVPKTEFRLNLQGSNHPLLAYSVYVMEVGKENLENYTEEDYASYFANTISAIENSTNCTAFAVDNLDGKDYKGRSVVFKNEQHRLHLKSTIYLKDGLEYRTLVIAPEVEAHHENISLFMDSFEFME